MEASQPTSGRKAATLVASALGLAAGALLLANNGKMTLGEEGSFTTFDAMADSPLKKLDSPASSVTLNTYTEYELNNHKSIGGELVYGPIVQAFKETTLSLSSGAEVIWVVNGEKLNTEPASSITTTFDLSSTTAEVACSNGLSFTVYPKVVRRELRDLTEDDRERYFAAIEAMYSTSQEDGVALYGEKFQSADDLLRTHLAGAADKSCDHWHDDAGMLNHHIGATWKFEQSLRAVDESTAAHYWDYTREYGEHVDWYKSEIFLDDWFGSTAPTHPEHVLNKGRFAYLKVMSDAKDYSSITNPYGLLRSPWNTNPTPYLMRSNYTVGKGADGYGSLPTCDSFVGNAGKSLRNLMFVMNGQLHGPVHIMTGGHWNLRSEMYEAAETVDMASEVLLIAKFLWRQGAIRTPKSCSADTESSDCKPGCPRSVIGEDITLDEFLDKFGVNSVSERIPAMAAYMRDTLEMSDDDIIDSFCEVGYAGDMFTSASPQDPLFWAVHGHGERYVQLLRVLKEVGDLSFDETWGYGHTELVASDTHLVCDWSSTSDLELPSCSPGSCEGHRSDDILPFADLVENQDKPFTNLEFYQFIHPFNKEMPYVYDSLDNWPGCEGGKFTAAAHFRPISFSVDH